MFVKSILIAALAAIAVAAPTPDYGRHRQGHEGHRHGKWNNNDNNDWSPSSNNDSSDSSDSSNKSSDNTASASSSTDETKSTDAPSDNQVDSGSAVTGGRSGKASFYSVTNPGENHGYAAGTVSCSDKKYSNDDFIVALASQNFEGGALCGKQVRITDASTGKTVTAELVDECASCDDNQLDLTPVVWHALHGEDESDGVFNINWEFV